MILYGQEIDLEHPKSTFFHGDCIEGMKAFPDGYFDLAVVDPPYGDASGGGSGQIQGTVRQVQTAPGGAVQPLRRVVRQIQADSQSTMRGGGGLQNTPIHTAEGGRAKKYHCKAETAPSGEKKLQRIEWDIAPPKEYFQELFRVSKNQIIWGGNYFALPPTRCFLIWRKLSISAKFSMAMAEYAWTSFNSNAKVYECVPQDVSKTRFHPTQKPVRLYEWILANYAKESDIILDTHVGSGSSLIACRNTNHKYVGFEIDDYYYEKAKERIEAETAQMNLYDFNVL